MRSTTYARFGNYSYQITPTGAYEGISLPLWTALANAIHYVSIYLYDNVAGLPQVALDGRAFYDMAVIGGADGSWVRYGVQIPAVNASGSTRLSIRLTTAEVFYVDAIQVEQNSYGTTYIDGDRAGLYKWSGLRHGSASTRNAQERAGGRERNLLDDYSVEVVEGTKRIGVPPVQHNLLGQSLQPGALYQGMKVLPREIELRLNYSSDTWAGFHGKRGDVFDLMKPDLVRGSQPVVIGYAGAGTNKRVYASFYYNGGMEFGDFLAYDEVAAVRLLAPDPYWYADDQETAVLDYQDSLIADNAFRRMGGQWQVFAPVNGAVHCYAYDYQRGRLYMGGAFTVAGSVTANRVCYWDGSQFVAMRGGVGGIVYALAIAPNGDVWVGGAFTTVDGVSSRNYLAKWSVSTNSWTDFGTSGTATVRAIAIDSTGLVYIGGQFTNWDAIANADYIVSYNGASFAALSTGADAAVMSLVIDANDDLILGGSFGSLGGVSTTGIGKWTGAAFSAIAGGTTTMIDLERMAGGEIFCCVASSTTGYIYNGAYLRTITLPAAPLKSAWNGKYLTIIGDASAQAIYGWNGYTVINIDASINSSVKPNAVEANVLTGDVFLGLASGAALSASGINTVTNDGTAAACPRLSVINANSSGSCTVDWLENQSDDHTMYFDLDVQAGETVELDLANSQKKLVSDWRGTITDNPLRNSDVVNWKLLPGANTIAAFITGTVTSVTALLHWTPVYWSADGAA